MGRPKTCNPCCGGGSGSSSSSSRHFTGSIAPLQCIRCIDGVAPAQWTVTISGITANSCPSGFCTAMNRTWTLTQGSACGWSEQITAGANCFGLPGIGVSLTITTTSVQLLVSRAGNTMSTYGYTVSPPIDCLTSYTVSLISTSPFNECTGWPASLTVSPA